MGDTYQNFQNLSENQDLDIDFKIECILAENSKILVMAPHGGGIEPYTAPIVKEIAGNDFSYYIFKGIKKNGNSTLHITSHNFDEPTALKAVGLAKILLAVHGWNGDDKFVMVGGRNERLRRSLEDEFEENDYPIKEPHVHSQGRDPKNICNRVQGGGAQLELSEGFRDMLQNDPTECRRFIEIIRKVLREISESYA